MMGNMRFLIVLLVVHVSVAAPVTKEIKDNEISEGSEELKLEYERYMTQVVTLLETDEKFKAQLENATKEDILSGKIADQLVFVNHTIRSQLDELKRIELDRLSKLYLKMKHEEDGLDIDHMKIKEHVDHENPHTFEIRDLKKLINKVTKDLEEVDKKRREKFKEYEMEKQFEQEEKMEHMNEEDKKKYEHDIDEMKKKHKEHEPLHSPGSKKQLEEVWEKQDHMEQEFDPRTFFYLHDLNGDGVWDQDELKALFLKELDKLYEEGHPEDDLMEKAEELERMREHVLREADVNRDGFISYEEFLNQSKKTEFEKDPGWKSLDEEQLFSQQEFENYKHMKKMEMQQAISRGMSPDYHPGGQVPAGHQQFPADPNSVPYQQQQYQHQQQQQQYVNQQYNSQYPQQAQYQPPIQHQGQFAAPAQQQQNYHPNQQPVGQGSPQQQYQQPQAAQNQNLNSQQQQQYHQQPIQNTNQQFQQQPIQNTNQQFQQQPIQNTNQQFQQQPIVSQGSQQQQPNQQQQYQQQQQQQQYQPNLNQQPQQQNNQQPNQLHTNQIPQQVNQLNTNQIPQQTNQHPSNSNNVNQVHQQNLPNPAAAQNNGHGANQAQIASLNNAAQSH